MLYIYYIIALFFTNNKQTNKQTTITTKKRFLVDDLDATCTFLEEQGVSFKKKPAEGSMRGLVVVYNMFLSCFLYIII